MGGQHFDTNYTLLLLANLRMPSDLDINLDLEDLYDPKIGHGH